jgi:hypothetical protein
LADFNLQRLLLDLINHGQTVVPQQILTSEGIFPMFRLFHKPFLIVTWLALERVCFRLKSGQ